MKTQIELDLMLQQRPQARTTKFMILTLALTLAAFTVPTTSWAGDTLHLNFKGPSANASFFTSGECVQTFVQVFASDNVSHDPPGPPNSSSSAVIFIDSFDFCTGTSLLSAVGDATLAAPDFQVDGKKLTSATLNTTINVFDFVSESSFDVTVDLTWTARGDIRRSSQHTHSKSTGFFSNAKFTSTERDAEAAASVSDGLTNFTPNPTNDAFIQNVKSGGVLIFKF